MASKFLVPVRDQSFLEVVSYREVLGDDHLVWTVIDVVEGLDLSVLYGRYLPDVGGGGRPAFDPVMMTALLIFGYCEGKRSSRQLEDACRRDWAYRAICGGLEPDHATIARFRASMDDVLESLFGEVLMACADAGMINVGVVALDGTKMGSVASKEANRTAPTLARMEAEARRMLDEAARADSDSPSVSDSPDNSAGTSAGGGDSPLDGAGLDNSAGVSNSSHDSDSPVDGSGLGRVSSESRRVTDRVRRGGRIREALRVVTEAVARRGAEETKRGRPKRPVGNVTDPESRLQKTRNGFIQGYNAQVVVSGDQVVVACDVTPDGTDSAQLTPMLTAAKTNVADAGVRNPIGVALADAGYASQVNFESGAVMGIDLLVATEKTHKVGERDVLDADMERDRERIDVFARVDADEYTVAEAAGILGLSRGWTLQLYGRYRDHGDLASDAMLAWRAMGDKFTRPENRYLYRKRGWMVEGSFAHTKTHRGTDEFLRHGLAACQAEWNLINIAGNLNKLHKKRCETRTTRSTDPSGRPNRPKQGLDTFSERFLTPRRRPEPETRHHNLSIQHAH